MWPDTRKNSLRIVAAAIIVNGVAMTMPPPKRHADILKGMPERMARKVRPSEQGFLLDDGRFVGRTDALIIAAGSGQLLKPTKHAELFSEDLW